MPTSGYFMGYLMILAGIALCLLGHDQRDGGMATAGAILLSTTWYGFFVAGNQQNND